MGFIKVVQSGFANYVSVRGTANRRDFWLWLLFVMIVLAIATIIDGALIGPMRGFLPFEQEAGRPLATALLLALTPPTVTVAVRRLHDSEWSGWWLLACFTVVGAILPLYLLLKSGKKSDNRFSLPE